MISKYRCHLHVYFHGCSLSADHIGTNFIVESGLLEMADANNIVLLLPQVQIEEIIIIHYADSILTEFVYIIF